MSDKKSMEEEIKQLIKSGLVNGEKKNGDKLKREQTCEEAGQTVKENATLSFSKKEGKKRMW